jgi:hypothetical protein
MKQMLESMLGSSIELPPSTIDQVMANLPKSPLPANPLVTMDAEICLRHARRNSFPDWLAMRCNTVDLMAWPFLKRLKKWSSYCNMPETM